MSSLGKDHFIYFLTIIKNCGFIIFAIVKKVNVVKLIMYNVDIIMLLNGQKIKQKARAERSKQKVNQKKKLNYGATY